MEIKEQNVKNGVEPWVPNFKWFAKVFAIVVCANVVIYFLLNLILKPYLRIIPQEITPWLVEPKIFGNITLRHILFSVILILFMVAYYKIFKGCRKHNDDTKQN